jgi:DNA-binding transcriptional ArsR family regulator
MVEYRTVLAETYAALADPSRLAILERLKQEELRVTEIAQPFDMSLNAVSKHLKVLERAGLVRRRINGREHYFSIEASLLGSAAAWLEQYRASGSRVSMRSRSTC